MINAKRYQKDDILLMAISFYSFSTITQRLYPISINRILTAFIIVMLCIRKTYRKDKLYVIFALVLLGLYTITISINKSQNINDFIYFFIAILMLIEFRDDKAIQGLENAYSKRKSVIDKITFINLGIIVVELMMPMCYSNQWGEKYFCGLTNTAHTMASSVCLNMAFMLLYLMKKRFRLSYLAILCVELVAIFSTGARIFLIPGVIIIFYYISNKIKKQEVKSLLYGVSILLLVTFFLGTGMYNKFVYAATDPFGNATSFLESFTSGRSVFWLVDLEDYTQSNLIQQLFGHGFDYIYRLNLAKVAMEIWAHNDFINLLVSVGLSGLLLYIYVLRKLFLFLKRSLRSNNYYLIMCYMLIPAFLNGFYTYAHYMFSFYVLLIVMKSNDNKTIKNYNQLEMHVWTN